MNILFFFRLPVLTFVLQDYLNGHHYICFKKFRPKKNLLPTGRTGQTGFFEYFGLYFFGINIMMAFRVFILFRIWCSIRIWNQISKKIFKLSVLRPKNGQTEFDRVPTLNYTYMYYFLFSITYIKTGFLSYLVNVQYQIEPKKIIIEFFVQKCFVLSLNQITRRARSLQQEGQKCYQISYQGSLLK
jgi:hypothetical protein